MNTPILRMTMVERHSVGSEDSIEPELQGSWLARSCCAHCECEFSSCGVLRYHPRVAQQTAPNEGSKGPLLSDFTWL